MVFSGTTFLMLFLPALMLLYFLPIGGDQGRITWKNCVLLAFSLLFYSWGEPIWIWGMVVITVVNHYIALSFSHLRSAGGKKLFLGIAVVISLSMLAYFKYAAFFANSIAEAAGISWRMGEQHLPIGISFYTFQVLTYTVDVYRGKAEPQKNPLWTLLYISCFPQLIAGPIVQYADVAQALTERKTTAASFASGMERFLLGLGKKILLANVCGQMLETMVQAGTGTELSFCGAWFGAALYTMQLYFDFSAYSDMAIGLGKVLGFQYKENFNHPYIASSITDFWRRWHMSLSGFFRDYVYIPLGGNRKGTLITIRNMLVVWVLTGLWHGASWNFVAWGAFYFVFLVLERFVFGKLLERTPAVIRHILTLAVVMIGWVLFYYTDLSAGWQHILAMFGLAGRISDGSLHFVRLMDDATIQTLRQYTVYPLIAAVCCLPLLQWMKGIIGGNPGRERVFHIVGDILLFGILAVSIMLLLGQSYNPFIYFRF